MLKASLALVGSVTLAAAMTGCSGYGQTPAPSSSSGSGSATPPPAAPPAAVCNAQPAQFAVGQNSTSSVMESARARSGAQLARILRPGQMITKEFDAQRLNLEVDANGRIIAVRCG
ncbi:proteinase inhibitor I78 [Acidovorax sp. sif1233]|uniref:I78 family peptidase inhibitor n=1 Tax=unclassified Acidovorax TaxID=2684926 RepID=UPI001C454484|nr:MULTISPECIES: I78 family peptidase inhibitor [unclassified Acidovorax]MBV7431019.1 proteinase inhibitor I78 [Acidovorax sp. sif0732]MBV7452125.1 proteinase inhibitor I78 [Acidovorax sp. sif0715]MBV7453380.1 proteinase inhibitor I78 [Acidovorax sp. sif1233]